MMRRLSSLVALTIFLFIPFIVFAAPNVSAPDPCDGKVGLQAATCRSKYAGTDAGFRTDGEYTLIGAIGTIVQGLLGLLGVLFLILIIWGGYQWMVAGGEEEKVTHAKSTLTNAIIGLAVVLGAWAIYSFIANILGI